MTTKEKATGT